MSFLLQVAAWFSDPQHWTGVGGIPNRLLEHVEMSAGATAAGALVALPLGILLGHYGRGGNVAISLSNVGRAVPSFGVLVIALELVGIGAKPAFVALFLLAIPPMVTNSYVGIRGVDAEVKDAARGMGMRERKLLTAVEIPLALPLIMAGIRISAVNVVATATLAAEVAWGGLGRYIVDGLGQRDPVQVFAGALLVAMLAILTELGLAGVEGILLPGGLKQQRSRRRWVRPGLKAA
ncbi:MAG TPA: ABC transporter permease [Candidatus Dormibacteraeota bacterium]